MRYSPQMLDRKHLKSGCPEKSGKPDFIGLGTPKAGTSWWYQLLVEHPKIKDNDFRVIETCYFCHPWDNDENNAALAHYETGFGSATDALVGEWSTLYFSHPFALERVIESYPNAKKLVAFREPVSCLKSWVSQIMRNRASKMLHDDEESRQMYWLYDLLPSLYTQIMNYPDKLRWLMEKEGDNLLVLQYEANQTATQRQLDKTLTFLEQDSFEPPSLSKRINAAGNNDFSELTLPAHVERDLRRCGRALLSLCNDFDPALWEG
mgnify:FL=1